MAPTDFEKDLRERLNKREIQPSESAWERISERLSESGTPAGSYRWRWMTYAAAACLLLLLGLGTYSLLRSPELPEPAVVRPEIVPDKAPMDIPVFESAPQEVTTLPEPEREAVGETDNRIQETEVAAELPESQRPVPIEVPARDTSGLAEEINSHLDAILAEVAVLESRQGGVSDAEIDSLLRRAQQQIAGSDPARPGDTVDAMALLMETEEELDRSFREDLFDRLKTGFIRVRTAVAARND